MYTFHKSEKLCSKKLIAQLFTKGNQAFTRFPFRFIWVSSSLKEVPPIQVLFVVSKRNFPKATDRNKVKRQLRELYRLSKNELYDCLGNDNHLALAIIYSAPVQLTYKELAIHFETATNKLKHEFSTIT